MADLPKLETRSGGDDALGSTSLKAILQRMHGALEERARPILEEMRAVQQLLDKMKEDEELQSRRRMRAAERQATARPADNPASVGEFLKPAKAS